ncbi:MAG: AAA family ATPase [Pseudomonadota bacterium]
MVSRTELAPDQLHWVCDPKTLNVEVTEQMAQGIVGQDIALKAIEYSLLSQTRGQNVFVRGVSGSGRMTSVMKLLNGLSPKLNASDCYDLCYVHNFSQADKPRLLKLPVSSAKRFRRMLASFIDFVRSELPSFLEDDESQSTQATLLDSLQKKLALLSKPFNEELAEKQMTLLPVGQGNASQQMIVPLINGKAVGPQEYQQLVKDGEVSADLQVHFKETHAYFMKALKKLNREAFVLNQEHADRMFSYGETLVRGALDGFVQAIKSQYDDPSVALFLDEVVDDVVDHVLSGKLHEIDFDIRYGINVVLEHDDKMDAPIIIENSPSLYNLIGAVEPFWEEQTPKSDYRGVRAGAILRAHGGYLILDVNEILSEPGAWRALMRTLKTGVLEIVPKEMGMYMPHMVVKPESIKVRLRVVLMGDAKSYYLLRQHDLDFAENFKVLSDFDVEMENCQRALDQYVYVVAYVVNKENLLPFSKSAIAALCEYGMRQAGHRSKLSTRFGRIADLVRESAFIATQTMSSSVEREHIQQAVSDMSERNMLPSRKFKELINRGTIIIQTTGEVIGQVNGLAVMSSGEVSFGFPARITATIGAGRAGLIDVEGRSSLSGSIHTKGVNILGGLLRHLLQLTHPLSFSASLAFEQSYGGIDGDSASGAETCCLLSALTGIPINQGFAMTGAIDQHGHIQAIGGVNEKIEGFFDACKHIGLTGTQGVIIPQSNVESLMLREDVVEAVRDGHFSVHAVETIYQALEVLTGVKAGEQDANGVYPEGSLLAKAQQQATQYWKETLVSPDERDD